MAALVFLDRDSLSVRLKQSQSEEEHQKNKHKDVAIVSIKGSPRLFTWTQVLLKGTLPFCKTLHPHLGARAWGRQKRLCMRDQRNHSSWAPATTHSHILPYQNFVNDPSSKTPEQEVFRFWHPLQYLMNGLVQYPYIKQVIRSNVMYMQSLSNPSPARAMRTVLGRRD